MIQMKIKKPSYAFIRLSFLKKILGQALKLIYDKNIFGVIEANSSIPSRSS